MARKTSPLLPSTDALLRQLGARLRIARLRRKLLAKQLAERAGMSPMTLRSIERGGAGVTLGAYAAVMQALGLERDLELLAQADPVGRELQDARLSANHRVASAAPLSSTLASPEMQSVALEKPVVSLDATLADWRSDSGFVDSESLAMLIKLPIRPAAD